MGRSDAAGDSQGATMIDPTGDRTVAASRFSAVSLAAALVSALTALFVILVMAPAARAEISDPGVSSTWTRYEVGFGASEDCANAVALAGGDVAYVAGYAGNASGNVDLTLAKYVNGVTDPVWGGKKTWDGPNHNYDRGNAVATGPGGVVYTVGTTIDPGCRAVVIKWSAATGDVLWVRRFGATTATHWGDYVGVDRRGNVVAAGTSEIGGKRDWYVVSWSAKGRLRWSWTPGALTPSGTFCNLAGLVVARDGSVYATGHQNDSKKALTVRLSSTGKRLWANSYRGWLGKGASAYGIAARPGGGVYVCGTTKWDPSLTAGVVWRYTSTGARKVFFRDFGPDYVGFTEVAVTSDGSVVAAGYDYEPGFPVMHYALYTPTGLFKKLGDFGFLKHMWAGVATDAFGGFYLTADTDDAGGNARIETRRLSVTTGGGSWTGLFQPWDTAANQPMAIAARGSTVVVVGTVDTGGVSGKDQFAIGYTY